MKGDSKKERRPCWAEQERQRVERIKIINLIISATAAVIAIMALAK